MLSSKGQRLAEGLNPEGSMWRALEVLTGVLPGTVIACFCILRVQELWFIGRLVGYGPDFLVFWAWLLGWKEPGHILSGLVCPGDRAW